jgi:iron complex outermembrane receptor protein
VFSGFKPSDAGAHARTSKALYVDFENKLTEQWIVSAAGRFEDYSDFGNSSTGKLATRYELTKGFAVRASLSSGFRAPHLAQQWFSTTSTNFIGGVPFEISTFPVSTAIGQALGASLLTPEKSINWSGGFTWQPIEAFTSSVDFYQIEIDDRIVLSSNFTGVAVSNFLVSRGLPAVGGGRYFTNGVDTKTEGVDVTLRYAMKLENAGKLTLTASGNANKTEVTKFKATPPQLAAIGITTPLFDLTEKIRMEKGQPRNTINLIANYDLGAWSFMLRNIRYGEVSAVQLTGASQAQIDAVTPGYDVSFADTVPAGANKQVIQTYGAKWITDLDVTYRVSKQLKVSVGMNNLFNVYPDQNVRSKIVGGTVFAGNDNQGSLPYLTNPTAFGFNGASYYGKVSYKF